MYINATTVGPAGFYNLGTDRSTRIPAIASTLSQPVPATPKSWGSIKAIYKI